MSGADGSVDVPIESGSDLSNDGTFDVEADGASDIGADGASPTSFEINTPMFSAPANTETTECVVLDLGNTQSIHVGHVKATIGAPVYEMRVSAVTAADPTTPTPCPPFGDIGDAARRPLMFARNNPEDLSFPAGIGYTLPAHQLLRFEIHAWNPTNNALPVNTSTIFTVMSDSAYQHEAGFLMLEATEITIPPGAANAMLGPEILTLGPTLGAVSIFRLEGYTHDLGTNLTMGLASSATDPSPASIYMPNPWAPANPLVVDDATPLVLTAQGGIALTCRWNNSLGANMVVRGPSVSDERCAAFVSYYPAALSTHLCAHTSAGTSCL